MKKHICFVFLSLLVLSEAFLKKYLQYSSSFQGIYPYIAMPAVLIFIASIAAIISCLRKNNFVTTLWDDFTTPFRSSSKEYWILAAILLIGIFFRFFKLDSLFTGMTYDEAYKGLDGIAIRKFGERPIFLDWNGGREALVAYLVAISQTFFDYSILSVRIITPIMNCLLLVFFYLFAKTIFNSRVALLSTFLLAVSKWSIIHSRYGVRAGQFTVFEIAVLYFVARGIASERKNSWSFVIAGIIGGLGFYTYIGYRVFPLILLSFLLQKNVFQKLKNHKTTIIAGCIAGLVIVAPVAKFYLEHRASMTDRMKRTLVWNQKGNEYSGINPALLVLRSTKDTLGMFTYKGDTISRHNVEIEPMLSPFESAFFILGLIVVVLNFRKQHALFLILFFAFALLPGILSVGAPNTPRVLAALPPTMLFVSFGILTALQFLKTMPSYIRTAFVTLVLAGNLYTGANDALIRHPEILDSLDVRTSAIWGIDQ
jgi:dolichyl-phosphate-mannose-protein mannosyltransferase